MSRRLIAVVTSFVLLVIFFFNTTGTDSFSKIIATVESFNAAPVSLLFSNRGKAVLSAWTQRSSAHVCFGPAPIEIFHGKSENSPQVFTPPQKKTCVFRNLCLHEGNFTYFQDPLHPIPFEFSNTRGPLYDTPDPLVDTGASTHIYYAQDDWLHITVVSGGIPSSFTILDDPAVHVLVTPRFLDNPGHEFGDSTWPTFNAMLDSSMLDVSNQIVFLPVGGNGPGGWGGGYTGYPARTYESLSRRPIKRLDAFKNNSCFSWALAGNGGRYLTSPLPSPFSWRVMHDFVYERYSMQHNAVAPPFEPVSIVIRFKKHRHTFTNYDELVSELRRCYPSARVVLFKPEDSPTFTDEFNVLSSASVYITAGGGGFSSVFLPTNAVVIFAAACWPSNNSACAVTSASGVCCVQVERHIWSNLPYLHIAYYNYDGSPSSISPNEGGHYFALDQDYKANITQIFALIDRGLFLSRGQIFNSCA